jgi:pimeloyl-ACP methyl ester carboxylesterase
MTASSKRRVATFTAPDGIEIAYTESGRGPLAVFVHATGFCKEVCEPVIADVRGHGVEFRAVALDQRAHGDSGTPTPPFDWWDCGRDIVDLVAESHPAMGVGHSSGGGTLVLAELLRPGTFSSLVLVEPIILPPPYRRLSDHPMLRAALRRRSRFTSRQAAFNNYRSKRAFAGWQERALWAYVEGGFCDDGEGIVLKCAPESEAEFFAAATTHGAWDRLGEVETPTVIVAGEHSDTHQEPFLAELAGRFGNARYEIVPDTSHFVWMQRPDVIAGYVANALGRLS